MTKAVTSLTIDADLLTQIRLNKVNLSELVNEYLKVYLGSGAAESDGTINELEHMKNKKIAEVMKIEQRMTALKEAEEKKREEIQQQRLNTSSIPGNTARWHMAGDDFAAWLEAGKPDWDEFIKQRNRARTQQ